MDKEQKLTLAEIIAAAVLLAVSRLPALAGAPRIVLCILAYLLVGYEVLWEAVKNIVHGEIFDENFLMSVATVGAIALGQYPEAVAVMLFYADRRAVPGASPWAKAARPSRRSWTSARTRQHGGKRRQLKAGAARQRARRGRHRRAARRARSASTASCRGHEPALNTTALTGESLPRDVETGDAVISGCVNLTGLGARPHDQGTSANPPSPRSSTSWKIPA
jgi:Cd2+/Zn2+-exporting ATPase